MICFPDVNVWIALAVAEHAHHAPARKLFDGHEGSMIAFCRVTGDGPSAAEFSIAVTSGCTAS